MHLCEHLGGKGRLADLGNQIGFVEWVSGKSCVKVFKRAFKSALRSKVSVFVRYIDWPPNGLIQIAAVFIHPYIYRLVQIGPCFLFE